MREKLTTKNATIGLGVLAFIESLFVPVIVDPFLVAAVAVHRGSWVRYAVVSATFSVAGATCAYFIGMYAWDIWGEAILAWTKGDAAFARIAAMLDRGAFIFTMIGAVTPVPYKLTALAGGVFRIDFGAFLLASVIGRFGRYLLIAYLAAVGKDVALKVLPYMTWRRVFVLGIVFGVAFMYVLR